MASPDWLRAGLALRDPADERWRILRVGSRKVELGHPDRGRHEILRQDLIEWIETGQWKTESGDPSSLFQG